MQNFNFENELCKIKIPMSFTKLIKKPCYKNSVLKMMGLAASQIPSDSKFTGEKSQNFYWIIFSREN